MNLALFDFDGTITETDTWTPFMRLHLTTYETVYAYGDSIEDRHMLECAHEPFFRGEPLTDWSAVVDSRHPAAPR